MKTEIIYYGKEELKKGDLIIHKNGLIGLILNPSDITLFVFIVSVLNDVNIQKSAFSLTSNWNRSECTLFHGEIKLTQ